MATKKVGTRSQEKRAKRYEEESHSHGFAAPPKVKQIDLVVRRSAQAVLENAAELDAAKPFYDYLHFYL
jgi:hypothetical protein